jgi:glycosyltransferase involved in cell wall biosynthesis
MTTQFDCPLVSVITIFLNGERFIREAIESVLAQTMDRWELLLVDDGSTDRSTEIALWYENEYPKKIKYLEHEGHRNLGTSASRHLGVTAAQGKYIAFIDADDVWLPQRLERHLKVFEMFPSAVMVCGPTLYWFNWQSINNGWAGERDYVGDLFLPTGALIFSTVSIALFLGTGNAPAICSLTVRREIVVQVGGFEHIFRDLYEDQVVISKVCLAGPIVAIQDVLDRYRQHSDSLCHRTGSVGLYPTEVQPGRREFLDWLERYLTELSNSDRDLWEELRAQLWPYRHPRLAQADRLRRRAVSLKRRVKRRVVNRLAPAIRVLLPKQLYQWLSSVPDGIQYGGPLEGTVTTPALNRAKLNAIRAAYEATGVPPARIARQFGISRSDVQKALLSDAMKR